MQWTPSGHGAAGVRVQRLYEEMLGKLGTEFSILRELSIEDIRRQSGYQIGEGIRRLREGNVGRFPGFDGEYGTIQLFEPSELDAMEGQMSLFGQNGAGFEGRIRQEAKKRKAVREGDTGKKMPQAAEAEGRRQSASSELLNEEQLLAVRSLAPRTAVIAGPGTGKTKTLISHILYLLQHHRVKPSDITAVTFTNKAAQEMRTRLKEQLGMGKEEMLNYIPHCRIRGKNYKTMAGLLREFGITASAFYTRKCRNEDKDVFAVLKEMQKETRRAYVADGKPMLPEELQKMGYTKYRISQLPRGELPKYPKLQGFDLDTGCMDGEKLYYEILNGKLQEVSQTEEEMGMRME